MSVPEFLALWDAAKAQSKATPSPVHHDEAGACYGRIERGSAGFGVLMGCDYIPKEALVKNGVGTPLLIFTRRLMGMCLNRCPE